MMPPLRRAKRIMNQSPNLPVYAAPMKTPIKGLTYASPTIELEKLYGLAERMSEAVPLRTLNQT
jgi:hypothetical protein